MAKELPLPVEALGNHGGGTGSDVDLRKIHLAMVGGWLEAQGTEQGQGSGLGCPWRGLGVSGHCGQACEEL